MTISRANMDQQVRKPPMKKPVKKKAMGGMVPPAMMPPAMAQPAPMMPPIGMKRGGKVGRGDGACKKGRTKGKMV
jgi:hypothetical protein